MNSKRIEDEFIKNINKNCIDMRGKTALYAEAAYRKTKIISHGNEE